MSLNFIKPVLTPEELKERFPMKPEWVEKKKERDKEIADIFTGKDDRFLAIIGPCSADREDAVVEYTERLAKVQEKIKDKVLIIPRVYTNKPRTTGDGYKGMLHQPDPEKAPDLSDGIIAIRKMHLHSIEATGLFAADEMLYPDNWSFLSDILSYVAIGARSVENQQHRLVCSGLDIPVGMKNPTGGYLDIMLNSIQAAQHSHTFMYRDYEVKSDGNPLAHAVLRGLISKHGQYIANYHYEDINLLMQLYAEHDLVNHAVIIDSNHANSGKKFKEQIRIIKEVLHSRQESPEIHKFVKGVMTESYLVEGSHKIGDHIYGQSITDPCLGWEDTENLLYYMAEKC
ncbi:MAG: 3-deoxy-7-phosphoheptulonate synthase [Catonella sp.]|jgi:3-deoxy-7-phosphoheptulonate synthase|nr:3-deoxy-7-phosphoheptulonate synthase [Catonella sp.]MDY6356719.1 3-deoxy-7-phosphoheptulonate synthase [Catonella sp.]